MQRSTESQVTVYYEEQWSSHQEMQNSLKLSKLWNSLQIQDPFQLSDSSSLKPLGNLKVTHGLNFFESMHQYLNEFWGSVTVWFCYDAVTNVLPWNPAKGLTVPGYLNGSKLAVTDFLRNNVEHEAKVLCKFFCYIIVRVEKLQVTYLTLQHLKKPLCKSPYVSKKVCLLVWAHLRM